jgi:hypothetical protein
MKIFFESLERLKPPAQVVVVIGVFGLLFLVAINPVAAATIISFLAALVSLVNRAEGGKSKD